ncbi:MAG: hypothetical protein QXN20_07785, partial [Candidatus Bathyarchaeia archaeon]
MYVNGAETPHPPTPPFGHLETTPKIMSQRCQDKPPIVDSEVFVRESETLSRWGICIMSIRFKAKRLIFR